MKVPLRIYYDIDTGHPIQTTGNFEDRWLTEYVSVDDQILKYTILTERVRDSFDVLELPYGSYSQDFAECNGYRVNPETKELEFSYPDPNEPEEPPVYEAPLSEKVASLEQENQLLKAQNNALSERANFIEDVVAEMATQVYQ